MAVGPRQTTKSNRLLQSALDATEEWETCDDDSVKRLVADKWTPAHGKLLRYDFDRWLPWEQRINWWAHRPPGKMQNLQHILPAEAHQFQSATDSPPDDAHEQMRQLIPASFPSLQEAVRNHGSRAAWNTAEGVVDPTELSFAVKDRCSWAYNKQDADTLNDWIQEHPNLLQAPTKDNDDTWRCHQYQLVNANSDGTSSPPCGCQVPGCLNEHTCDNK